MFGHIFTWALPSCNWTGYKVEWAKRDLGLASKKFRADVSS